jgi:hypothetical protein
VNTDPHSSGLLRAALAALKRTTGLNATGSSGAVVRVKSGKAVIPFAPHIKNVDRFQTPAQLSARGSKANGAPLLVAPFITRDTAERCRQLGLSFIDTAGNAHLRAPGLFVYVTGEPRPKDVPEARFRALTASGLQVTFALLARPALIRATYREIAAAAGAALGSVTPAIGDLEKRGLISTARDRKILDPRRLLEEWVTHYPISLRPKLHVRRFEGAAGALAKAPLKTLHAYWGSERAAERLTGFLKSAALTIYAHKPVSRVITALRLRANPSGNVEVLDAFWKFDPDRRHPDLVPPVLAYADLLASRDGRNIEAAKLIYDHEIEPAFHSQKAAH